MDVMKKSYIKPTINCIVINARNTLLTASSLNDGETADGNESLSMDLDFDEEND